MAEEFALEQRSRNGAHVHRHHGTGGTVGKAVNLARQHFLSGSVLAGNEDIGIGGRGTLHHLAHAAHGLALAPEHGRTRLLSCGGRLLLALAVALHQQHLDEPFVVKGFHQKVGSAQLQSVHRQVNVGIGREQHDGRAGLQAQDFL